MIDQDQSGTIEVSEFIGPLSLGVCRSYASSLSAFFTVSAASGGFHKAIRKPRVCMGVYENCGPPISEEIPMDSNETPNFPN